MQTHTHTWWINGEKPFRRLTDENDKLFFFLIEQTKANARNPETKTE